MARRKKSTLLAQGKERRLDGTGWPWRVRLYAPPPGGTSYQVIFKAPAGEGEPWKRVLRRANNEAEARKIFAQAEAALDTEQAAPARLARARDSDDRGARREVHRGQPAARQGAAHDPGTRVPAERPHHPGDRRRPRREVAGRAQPEGDGAARRRRSTPLAAARTCAEPWPPCASSLGASAGSIGRIDPLDGLEIGRSTVLQGATTHYVDPRLRPETRQVKAMADAADKLCGPDGTDPLMTRLPLFGTKIRVAGFGGLRLGEQNGLRAIDVFFDRGYVQVNGSWITPRHSDGFRGPVKNHVIHEVPLPRSLMHDELLPRVKELLGLPANASLQRVINAQEEERQRRAKLAAREQGQEPSPGGTTPSRRGRAVALRRHRRPACR